MLNKGPEEGLAMLAPSIWLQVTFVGFKVTQLDGKARAAQGQGIRLAQVVGGLTIALCGGQKIGSHMAGSAWQAWHSAPFACPLVDLVSDGIHEGFTRLAY